MPSESPYDKHGGPLEEPERTRALELRGNFYETPFSVAHEGVGEWRYWREFLEVSEIQNPFDLFSRTVESDLQTAEAFDNDDAYAEFTDVDWFGEADTYPDSTITSQTPDLVVVRVEDNDPAQYEFSVASVDLNAVDPFSELVFGDPFVLTDQAIEAQEFAQNIAIAMDLPNNAGTLDLRVDQDQLFLLWSLRQTLIRLNPTSETAEVLIPRLETTATARGE